MKLSVFCLVRILWSVFCFVLGQMYPAELEIKDITESITSASYLDLLMPIGGGGMVNFTLPFTTKEMISISTSQTFRYWVVIFHLCRLIDVAHDIGASFTFSNRAHVWRSFFLYKHGPYITYYISLGRYWNISFTIVRKISTIHRIKGKIHPQELE